MTELPIACDREAIPLDQRAAHAYVGRVLFGERPPLERVVGEREGLRFTLDAGAFDDLARWITWERLCCPFLEFAVNVAPAGGPITLTLTGPSGTLSFLEQEMF